MNIFFDVDETLVFTSVSKKKGALRFPHSMVLPNDPYLSTVQRPCTPAIIKFARDLVGHDKVFLLSIGTLDYLLDLNQLFDWGFDREHIFAREDLNASTRKIKLAYGSDIEVDPTIWANPDNVLVDNALAHYNQIKILFIGIKSTEKTNYLEVFDYLGGLNENKDNKFYNKVTSFLKERYESSQPKRKDNSIT